MKRIIFIICFLYSLCCFSQVSESFSDGNFSIAPCWEGNIDKFRISPDYGVTQGAYGLQLYDPGKAGEAYLSTASTLIPGATWEFKTFFYGFKPGGKSFAKFYLSSTKQTLSGELDGYYILLGGSGKNISLIRQNGVTPKTLISGNKTSLDLPQCTVLVKVTCSDNGVWTLYSMIPEEDVDWKNEGQATDKTITDSQYTGIYCKYATSNSTFLYIDDISIHKTAIDPGTDPDNPGSEDIDPNDKTRPTVTSVTALTDSTFLVGFSEEVTLKNAHFAVNGDEDLIKSKRLDSGKKKASFMLSFHLKEDQLYELSFWGVEDLNGNAIQLSSELFSYQRPSVGVHNFGSVIFNEIMVNPNDVKGLPESEYIELFNRTDTLVSLSNCALFYGGKKYLLPDIKIEAMDYVVLCNQKNKDLWTANGTLVTGVSSFPALLNTGKLLWLEDEKGNLVSWVEYSDTWYKDSKKKSGGYSLECIDPDNLSNDALNWQATNDVKGGTPAAINSVIGSSPDNTAIVVLSSFMQSPDTIVVNFNKPMDISSLSDLNNYRLLGTETLLIEVIPDYPCGRNVKLVLNTLLKAGQKIELELHDLLDVSGDSLAAPIALSMMLPEQIEAGDVLFNEILFKPHAEGTSYIELSNVSDKTLSCNQLYLSLLKEDGSRSTPVALSKSPINFPQKSVMFFAKQTDLVSTQYNCDISHGVVVSEFPSLSDEKGSLLLLSAQGDLLDEMVYSESMHTTTLKDRSGISLEKKAPELLSADSTNWASASFLSGYGTPGLFNRCDEQTSSSANADFWLEKKSFSPMDNENSKLQIRYLLVKEGFVANIRIYEASGREVCTLAENNELLAEGTIEWDGKEQNKNVCRIGLYVVYIEIHNTTGEVKKYKLPFALVR